ncbi:ankyrin repeat domain-containing protein [Sphingomonas arenae]|uniref:ankyrin repeat domain-containing protein n=1 Tax=Sphingomonas arenae TaxID=2812555 RepID=UPI001967A5F4|nr:ankyrin repeat domain-containing protein [Sphingomonas arenae]
MTRKRGIVAACVLALAAVPAGAQFASGGFTFLQAVQQRDGAKATEMLNSPGSSLVNFRNDEGTGALHIVTQRRDTQWLRFLMSKGADVNLANGAGDTPLHLASRSGWVEGMDVLLDAGARVDRPNRLGETALIMAVQQKQVAAVRRLLEAGANPDKADNASGRSARDYAKLDTRSTEMIRLIEQTKSKKPAAVAGPKL